MVIVIIIETFDDGENGDSGARRVVVTVERQRWYCVMVMGMVWELY